MSQSERQVDILLRRLPPLPILAHLLPPLERRRHRRRGSRPRAPHCGEGGGQLAAPPGNAALQLVGVLVAAQRLRAEEPPAAVRAGENRRR